MFDFGLGPGLGLYSHPDPFSYSSKKKWQQSIYLEHSPLLVDTSHAAHPLNHSTSQAHSDIYAG